VGRSLVLMLAPQLLEGLSLVVAGSGREALAAEVR
jgi:hypothetical protein